MMVLTGCLSDEEMEAQARLGDRNQCSALGFSIGSTAMANCMNTAATKRQTIQAEERAQDREWSKEYDRKEAEKNANRDQAAAIASVPPMTTPTIERIPGASGEDANMSMCSDGALREDCADAPNGY